MLALNAGRGKIAQLLKTNKRKVDKMKTIQELKTELEEIIDRMDADERRVKPFIDLANLELSKLDDDAFFYQSFYEAKIGSKSRLADVSAKQEAELASYDKERLAKANKKFTDLLKKGALVEGNLLMLSWEKSVEDGTEFITQYFDIKDMSEVSPGGGNLKKLRSEKTTHQVEKEVIINLTQHSASAEQLEDGVVEPAEKAAVQAAITFDAIPSSEEMVQRAQFLVSIAKESGAKKAMIGGAPFFMSTLERVLSAHGITPVYAFSVREAIEKDGVKTSIFKHAGFVEVE